MRGKLSKFRLQLTLMVLTITLAVASFGTTVFAQTSNPAPAPTPVPPSGSNPTFLAPTDVAPDFALLCALGFFAFLLIWLIAATFYTRAGVFEDPNKDPGY